MKTKVLLSLCMLTALYGCQVVKTPTTLTETPTKSLSCIESNSGNYQSVLAHPELGWSECFNHQQAGLLESTLEQIATLARAQQIESQDLDNLLYYLRAHSYYTNLDDLTSEQWHKLNSTLADVANMKELYNPSSSNYRLLEHLLVALYQFSGNKKNEVAAEFAAKILQQALQYTQVTTSNIQQQYQQLELYRAIGFLAYKARGQASLKEALINEELNLTKSLQSHINALKNNDWRLENALWAAGNIHYLLPEAQQKQMDKAIDEHIFSNSTFSDIEKRALFSQNYLVNSFRYHEQCDNDFAGKCLIPTIDEILPINHDCSDSLFIRATEMTGEQLEKTCAKLTSQESFFHSTINSQSQAVSNDLNTRLRVVIFDNYSEYNRWGQLFFNIGTDNGGMYIEGQPEKVGNQATFYSFEAFWNQPDFSVWNLNHEYVHYLDGRFVKFGTYGHFPSHLVWWSEGLAEYIAKQQQNNKAFNLLNTTEQEKWPTLSQIFSTNYSDGVDRIYRWSYQAIRFIFEQYPEVGQQMAKALKQDDFASYQAQLNEFSKQNQVEFLTWQIMHQPSKQQRTSVNKTKERYKKQPLYRYLYRTYLRPQHLPVNTQHLHFSNWG